MGYWLMKTEPEVFSIEDLKSRPGQTEPWNGVRNYQARNFMRDDMRREDRVLFYHSNAAPPGVVGTARVAREGYPDPSAWDPDSPYFDPRSTPESPVWMMVDVRFESLFAAPLTLERLRREPALSNMMLLRKGMRLSVQPVTPEEFAAVLRLAERMALEPRVEAQATTAATRTRGARVPVRRG